MAALLLPAIAVGCTDPARSSEEVDPGRSALMPLPPPARTGMFTEVTVPAGIRAAHRLPAGRLGNIVDAVGSGAAFADLDDDGWLELIVLGGPRSPHAANPDDEPAGIRLYRNLRNGRFEEITARSGIPPGSPAVAVAVGDVDGDGDRDLYLADRGPNRLYLNDGHAGFRDVSHRAGVDDPGFGVGATFFDLEGDGDLDLYVTNYLEYDPRERTFYQPDGFPGPTAYLAQPDVLYENRGDGTFRDITAEAGIDALQGRGMSLAAEDVDDDGDTDLFVANDATENFLLLNDGTGGFSDTGYLAGIAMGQNGEQTSAMAADVGDVDGDGLADIVVSDTAFGAFYRRVAAGLFVDEVMRSGIGRLCAQHVSWGQNLLDVDNDGDLDLFVVNGGLHHLVGWEDLLLRNDGSGLFVDASGEAGAYFSRRLVGRSSITGDYDNDGDIDLFVTTLAGRHVLLRNDGPRLGEWITLDLVGRAARDPFGAKVLLSAGGRTRLLESRCPSAYLGQSDPRLHVGLGPGVDRIESIVVQWPDGSRTGLEDVPSGRILPIAQDPS